MRLQGIDERVIKIRGAVKEQWQIVAIKRREVNLAKMLAKSDRFAGDYCIRRFKCPNKEMYRFDSDKHGTFGVPIQVLTLSNMSHSKRKDLIHCLRRELEQIQMLQKKVELLRTNGLTVPSSSDILSCSNGQCLPFVKDIKKLPTMASESRKKIRDSSGKVKTEKHASEANTANIFWMKQCEDLLKRLMRHQYGWVFNEPVDVVKLNVPDYFNVIKHPMDLGTIKKKKDSGGYTNPWEFYDDVRLTFSNAMTYNPPGNDVHVMADTLNKFFEVRWKNIEKKLPAVGTQLIQSKAPAMETETSKTILPAKKRKTTSVTQQVIPEPVKRMTDEEKHKLGVELESLLTEMPMHIIDFLRENSSNGREPEEEEIEIDIDDLSDDT
ncbi:hypothetical protein V6N13_044262 [Hibiscus sabdariffa]